MNTKTSPACTSVVNLYCSTHVSVSPLFADTSSISTGFAVPILIVLLTVTSLDPLSEEVSFESSLETTSLEGSLDGSSLETTSLEGSLDGSSLETTSLEGFSLVASEVLLSSLEVESLVPTVDSASLVELLIDSEIDVSELGTIELGFFLFVQEDTPNNMTKALILKVITKDFLFI